MDKKDCAKFLRFCWQKKHDYFVYIDHYSDTLKRYYRIFDEVRVILDDYAEVRLGENVHDIIDADAEPVLPDSAEHQ